MANAMLHLLMTILLIGVTSVAEIWDVSHAVQLLRVHVVKKGGRGLKSGGISRDNNVKLNKYEKKMLFFYKKTNWASELQKPTLPLHLVIVSFHHLMLKTQRDDVRGHGRTLQTHPVILF